MKNIIVCILMILLISSCTKLDQVPESTVSSDAVFKSERGLQLYTNSFYNILPTGTDILREDAMSDFIARKDIPAFIMPGAYGPRQSTGWSWSALRNINYFLENNTNPNVPAEVRQHYNGLARFFRAWFYFAKVKRFGDVPWINKTFDVKDPELFKGRDSRVLIIDSVLADLDFAAIHIRTKDDQSRSLITKYIAHALISRVALFEGTFRKYQTSYGLQSTANTLLTKAAEAAQVIMEETSFRLHNTGLQPYRELFISKSPIASEVMLANIYDASLGVLHDANWYYTSASYGVRANFTRSFINTYLNIDGTPFTNNPDYATIPFKEEVRGRDLRLSQTIRTEGYTRINGGNLIKTPPVFSYTYTGYQPIKWVLDDVSYDNGARNDNIIPLFRFAEILLNYAEAKAELETLTDSDWDKTIGALRRRAGITGNTSLKPVTADQYLRTEFFPEISDPALLEIRRERGIELAMEGFRFEDLIRWKKGELMEKKWNGMYVPALNTPMDLNNDGVMDVSFYTTSPGTQLPGVTYVRVAGGATGLSLKEGNKGEIIWLDNIPRVWNDKFYLYPIPENDRLINPELGQNPGW
jgi:starch-binding outer membrane protein, SusD/RagB family